MASHRVLSEEGAKSRRMLHDIDGVGKAEREKGACICSKILVVTTEVARDQPRRHANQSLAEGTDVGLRVKFVQPAKQGGLIALESRDME
jgi:hypothetical protein